MRHVILLFLSLLIISWELHAQAPVLALKGNDPVALIEGEEIPGLADLTAVRGRYEYRFASKENLDRFKAEPEAWSIRFGGACMRMGPLSGLGDPARWRVYAGRIYLFASESCRDKFTADPARFIDVADRAPEGTDAQKAHTAEILGKAVVEIGGEDLLRSVRSAVTTSRVVYISHGDTTTAERIESLGFPAGYRYEERYEGGGWSWLLLPEAGYDDADSGSVVDEDVRLAMDRMALRKPIALLRAWLDGGAVAFEAGVSVVDGKEVALIEIGMRGATTTLGIDPESGRIRSATWKGRTTNGFGRIEHWYSDYRCAAGLILPYQVTAFADGKQLTTPGITIESIAVSDEHDEAMFRAPK